jgi:small conductance mechanosensitive channel
MDELAVKVQEFLAIYGLKVLAALLILLIGRWAARLARHMTAKTMEKSKVEATLVSFTTNLVYTAIMAFVIIAALAKLGFQTASFVAVLGAAGLAVGLAMQGSLSNFAAGVLLVIFRPFRVGDFIEAAGTMGTVKDIGIFTTELRSPDNKTIIVPNAKLTSDSITNYSANDTRRIDLVVGVSYGDDLDKVQQVLEAVIAADERILKDPAAKIAVMEMADSSVNLVVRPWVKTVEYWDIYFDLQKTIKQRLDSEGISIPFPQTDVHLFPAAKS